MYYPLHHRSRRVNSLDHHKKPNKNLVRLLLFGLRLGGYSRALQLHLRGPQSAACNWRHAVSSRLTPQCPWENDIMHIPIPSTRADPQLRDDRGGEPDAPRQHDCGNPCADCAVWRNNKTLRLGPHPGPQAQKRLASNARPHDHETTLKRCQLPLPIPSSIIPTNKYINHRDTGEHKMIWGSTKQKKKTAVIRHDNAERPFPPLHSVLHRMNDPVTHLPHPPSPHHDYTTMTLSIPAIYHNCNKPLTTHTPHTHI